MAGAEVHEFRVSTIGGEVERVRHARQKLYQVRQSLMTPAPEKLGNCGPALEEAARLLGSLLDSQQGVAQINTAVFHLLKDELEMLRRELAVVTALMQQASGYYLGWAQMLGAATSGYTNCGHAAALATSSQLSVEG